MSDQTPYQIKFYQFPTQEEVSSDLYWMGTDYLNYLMSCMIHRLRKDNPGTNILGLEWVSGPIIEKSIAPEELQKTLFNLHAKVEDGKQQQWSLELSLTFFAYNLSSGTKPRITYRMDIHKTELFKQTEIPLNQIQILPPAPKENLN